MDKSLNLKLVFLIVFLVVLLVGVTLYFHQNLDSFKAKYQETSRELKSTSEKLDLLEESLNKTQLTLGIKAQREEDISGKYTEVKETNKDLEETKTSLTKDLSSTKSQLSSVKQLNKDLISRVAMVESALSTIKVFVSKGATAIDDAKDAKNNLDDLQEDVEATLPDVADSIDDEIGDLNGDLNEADDALDDIMEEILEIED
jgi:chromosome segregation ATPase